MKHAVAQDLVGSRNFGLSGQVLAEFIVNVTKPRLQLPQGELEQWLLMLTEMPCVPVDAAIVIGGHLISRRDQISYWDGAILAAAERLGAPVVYSEDLSDGRTYGTVRVENPFRNH